jgi:hypothetical protein
MNYLAALCLIALVLEACRPVRCALREIVFSLLFFAFMAAAAASTKGLLRYLAEFACRATGKCFHLGSPSKARTSAVSEGIGNRNPAARPSLLRTDATAA